MYRALDTNAQDICVDKKLGQLGETCDSLLGDDENLRQQFCSTDPWIRKKCKRKCGVCCENNKYFKFESVNLETGEISMRSCNWLNKGDEAKITQKRQIYCEQTSDGKLIKDAW